MTELLLEILTEEIPARMQIRAADELKRQVGDRLDEARLSFESADAYTTPRRLALVIGGLAAAQPDLNAERKGPRVDAPDKAIEGFLGSVGLAREDCEVRETENGAFLFARIDTPGRPAADVLPDLLADAIQALPWPKSMRWGRHRLRFVRPMHGILCLLGGAPLAGRLDLGDGAAIEFGAVTMGHRFLFPGEFDVRDFADYKAKLETAYVMLDPADRRARIEEQAVRLADGLGLKLREDRGLLAEVAGLVEWPVALAGRIDDAYMDLPPEVLTTAMRTHQKYFALEAPDGAIAPHFVVVANMEAKDGGSAIVAGNERVLRARLADAKFFWDQDRKARLEDRLPALDDVIFHAKLGSLRQKVARIETIAGRLAADVNGSDAEQARRAARLAKADLVTEMVGEFPELQGVMGRYYAAADGEDAAVAEAIAEHYSPLGPNDRCPSAPVAVTTALADKVDTLVGFFAIDEKPTGSKDPYALRRAALGIIRLILENGLRLKLREVFALAAEVADLPGDHAATGDDLMAFFADRLKVHLKEQGVRHDLISAVFALGDEDDLVRLLARVEALGEFVGSDDGANLLTAYKRAANIVRIEEKKDGATYGEAPDRALFAQTEEVDLLDELGKARERCQTDLAREEFVGAMGALSALRRPVDAFFDEVTVNTDDAPRRANRLRLLSEISATLNQVADFSMIEG